MYQIKQQHKYRLSNIYAFRFKCFRCNENKNYFAFIIDYENEKVSKVCKSCRETKLKECIYCHEEKSYSDFTTKYSTKDYYSTICKLCKAKYRKELYKRQKSSSECSQDSPKNELI